MKLKIQPLSCTGHVSHAHFMWLVDTVLDLTDLAELAGNVCLTGWGEMSKHVSGLVYALLMPEVC